MNTKLIFQPLHTRRTRRAPLPRVCFVDRETIATLYRGRNHGLHTGAIVRQMIAEDETFARFHRTHVNDCAAEEIDRLESEDDADSGEDHLFPDFSVDQAYEQGLTVFGRQPYSS